MPGFQVTRPIGFQTLPSMSWSMKRPTRVPASTVVRMNSASNMIAKWYQKAFIPAPPNTPEKISDMPTARVGAPPVRAISVCSSTALAACGELVGGDGEAEARHRLRRRTRRSCRAARPGAFIA